VTPVEKLEAAIAKLERLREFSNGTSWSSSPVGGTGYRDIEIVIRADNFPDGFDDRIAEVPDAGDARLIVTLHRTIDAQLRILNRGVRDDEELWHDLEALALADAILGGDS
jgi:hypothetical protein